MSRSAVNAFLMKPDSAAAFRAPHLATRGNCTPQIDPDQAPSLIGPEFAFMEGHGVEYGRIGPGRKPETYSK
jgi:hypothetical protein